MNLLELLQEVNLLARRCSSTHGGEYHSPCPQCGGKDRFIIWPIIGRYWCRQCDKKGDAIQFCRDFLGMDYQSACKRVGAIAKLSTSISNVDKSQFFAETVSLPSEKWQNGAAQFASQCHKFLLIDSKAMMLLQERGITYDSVKKFLLGWNRLQQFLPLSNWGLPQSFKENGRERKLWLPKGLVIPYAKNNILKLKIRRQDWSKNDVLPKYVEISGSIQAPSIYGSSVSDIIVIVESELDAILIQQFASDLCCCVALGGTGKKPDFETDEMLNNKRLILFALDFDEAGKKVYRFWKNRYSQLQPWPVPIAKSPGDAFKAGIDLYQWIKAGINQYNFNN